jgi:hypothetical protein
MRFILKKAREISELKMISKAFFYALGIRKRPSGPVSLIYAKMPTCGAFFASKLSQNMNPMGCPPG